MAVFDEKNELSMKQWWELLNTLIIDVNCLVHFIFSTLFWSLGFTIVVLLMMIELWLYYEVFSISESDQKGQMLSSATLKRRVLVPF